MTYHIKKDSTPGICRAKNGNCPYGDISEHFSSKEEAQIYADKLNEVNPNDTIKKQKEIKSIKISNFNQEKIHDEIDYHVNRSEDRKHEYLWY